MNALAQQDFYLNSSQYTDLKKEVRANNAEANKTALQQFESLFITQMLKEMRAAAVVDKEQHSSYMDFYTDMYDKQLATIMARQGGIGIARQLQQQLDVDAANQDKSENKRGKFFPLYPSVAANEGMPLNTQQAMLPLHATAQEDAMHLPANVPTLTQKYKNPEQQRSETVAAPLVTGLNTLHIGTPATPLPEEFHQMQHDVDNSAVALSALGATAPTQHLTDEKIHAHKGWSQPEQFVQELMPHAQAVAKELGVKAEVIVAQSALETGWGKYTMRRSDGSVAFSLFGIKADHRWSGDTVQVSTLEFKDGYMQKEMAQFRAYDSVGEAVQDYVRFIKGSARYQQALDNKGDDAHYVKGLQKAGYATDPAYANKILNILHGDTLKQSLNALGYTREVV